MPREKEAAKMLLSGATLLAEPCPYCGGVRVLKSGDTVCVGCGAAPPQQRDARTPESSAVAGMESKLRKMAEDLEAEDGPGRKQDTLIAIQTLADTVAQLKGLRERYA